MTLKLYPAIVTLHLLGGMLLLALLARQHAAFSQQPLALPSVPRRGAQVGAVLLGCQIALGGWVSTNYAVLACDGFPTCRGQWWPEMDWAGGFTLLRGLGEVGAQGAIGLPALVAIHMAHRLSAVVLAVALGWLAWRLWQQAGADAEAASSRRFGLSLAGLLGVQVLSGLSNVVLGWPLVAALGHSAGAAGLVLVLSLLLARSVRSAPLRSKAPGPAAAAA